MAFPTIPTTAAGTIIGTTQADTTSTRTFPDLSTLTKSAGDLLIAICAVYDGNSTNAEFSSWGGGFTEFGDFALSATLSIGCAYKWSTGSETGTFTVTSTASQTGHAAMIVMAIPGAHDTTPPEAGGYQTGTAVAADPNALDPAGWAAEDTLWIAVAGCGETNTGGAFTGMGSSAPTNYTDFFVTGISADVVGGIEGAVAFRQLNAASEDPGAFSNDISNSRVGAIAIAVRPVPTAVNATATPSVVAGVTTIPTPTITAESANPPSKPIYLAQPRHRKSRSTAIYIRNKIVISGGGGPVAIRGTSPAVFTATAATVNGTLNGTRQPQTNDVLIIIHANDYYTLADMPTPSVGGSTSGVNAITNGTADAGSLSAHVKSYYYVVGSTGDLAVSVTETGTADEEKLLIVYVLSGVDTSNPIDVAGNNANATITTNHVLSAISPTSADAFLIGHVNTGGGSTGAYTSPSSPFVEQYNASFNGFISYAGGNEQLSASGSTGDRTFTNANNTAYGGVLIAVKTAPGSGNATATPTRVNGTTTIPTPTITAESTVSATTVSGTTTIPTPTILTSSLVTATVVSGTTTIPTPIIQASGNATATPTVVNGVTTIPSPTITATSAQAGVRVYVLPPRKRVRQQTSAVIARNVATITTSNATPSTVVGSTSIPTPTVLAGSTVAATTVSGTTSIPSPTISVGVTVQPIAVSATTTILTPAVFAGGNATVIATTVNASTTIPTPTIQAGSRVTPTVVSGTTTISAPTIRLGAEITPTTVSATVTIVTPTVVAGSNITATIVSATTTIPVPGITSVTNVLPAVVSATTTIPAPSISVGSVIVPVTVQATTTIPFPSIEAIVPPPLPADIVVDLLHHPLHDTVSENVFVESATNVTVRIR